MDELKQLVAEELTIPVEPRVSKLAAAIAAKHGAASRAVLFYGSCLREKQLDGLMLDFYLIVSNYRAAYDKRWLAIANRLIPPNVFYFEMSGIRAKYAVLSEDDFQRECSLGARSVSVWARFAQPSRLVWAENEQVPAAIVGAVAQAASTLFAFTRPAIGGDERGDSLTVFRAGLALTYGAEIRAEQKEKPGSIVDADPERYRRIGDAVMLGRPLDKPPRKPKSEYKSGFQEGAVRVNHRKAAQQNWRRMQRKGKALSVLRLAKGSATFAGGVDYIAWKINRHAGTQIRIKPWHRRWPLIAAISLLPRLLKSGAVR